jgi:hypothetical protein
VPVAEPPLLAEWLRLLAGCAMMSWAACCLFGRMQHQPGRRAAVARATGWSVLMMSGHGMVLFAAATPFCLSAASRSVAFAMLGVHLVLTLVAGGAIAAVADRLAGAQGNLAFAGSLAVGALLLFLV